MLDEPFLEDGLPLQVESGHLVPAAEVVVEFLHQLREKVNKSVLVKQLKVVIHDLWGNSGTVYLLDVFINDSTEVFLSKHGDGTNQCLFFCIQDTALKDEAILIELHSILRLLCELSDALAYAIADLGNDRLFPVIQQGYEVAIADELILIIMQKTSDLLKATEDILYPMVQYIFRFNAQYFGYIAAVPHLHHICSLLHVLYLADFAENAKVLLLKMLCQFMQGLTIIVQIGV